MATKYGIRITKKGAAIHVGELGMPNGYINGVWFGAATDIFDTEEQATAEIKKRLEAAVALHKQRKEDAENRLLKFERKGPTFKRPKASA